MSLRVFKSDNPNTFHYITASTNKRRKVFAEDETCQIFVDVIKEIKTIHPFKVVGYVIMPDHIHLIINPLRPEMSTILRKIKGKSGKLIIDYLKESERHMALKYLEINIHKRKYAVWLKKSSDVDLVSSKFIKQKLDYIHMNPVRAGLCTSPEEWKWSSYNAYLNNDEAEVPLKIDKHPYWTEQELRDADRDIE